jgi:hypothetical protein
MPRQPKPAPKGLTRLSNGLPKVKAGIGNMRGNKFCITVISDFANVDNFVNKYSRYIFMVLYNYLILHRNIQNECICFECIKT